MTQLFPSKCTHDFSFYCLGAGSPSTHTHTHMLMASGSMHFQLKRNKHDRTFGLRERNAWAPVSSTHVARPHPSSTCLPQPLSLSPAPESKHCSGPQGTGSPATAPEYQPAPMGTPDLHLRSVAFCLRRLQLLFKSKLDQNNVHKSTAAGISWQWFILVTWVH